MYLRHFNLTELPFSITPDTSFFMNRAGYQDALNVLIVALRSGEGFVKLTGEVGVGKTILCRTLMKSIRKDFVTVYIHNPYIKPESLLFSIADALSVKYSENVSQHMLMEMITRALLDTHRIGKKVVVCLDEVQAMPIQTLESLRLLTNLETEKRKLLQVVLFAQPELDTLLNQLSIRQLKQRITFSYNLLPLNKVAMYSYIRHRLKVAGCLDETLFTKRAYEAIYRNSNGIPRLINILCHKALICAYGEGKNIVTHKHINIAAMDIEHTKVKSDTWMSFVMPNISRWLYGSLGVLSLLIGASYIQSALGI
ncbi:MAG TPA: AAA family ATPase [Thiotrichaceae bacterium]|jgi:MSHA biogenesis protein MshM|nr:AAA family ATPase [Thiotrichaceae bacterium]HIM08970.1 AAA family ATPase [Gammaproteobacteria bacterium]